MSRIYIYKITADNNGAPCIYKNLLSLAICKPIIRKTAKIGDLIFGFAGDVMHTNNHLIYVARITDIVKNGDYYKDDKYQERADCIYCWDESQCKYNRRENAHYHKPDDLNHDLGKSPAYDRNMVLISNDFRYFGKSGTSDYKSEFSTIKTVIEPFKRGYLVNHTDELVKDLDRLKSSLWKNIKIVQGIPTNRLPNALQFENYRSCR